MNEIEKMFENVGLEKFEHKEEFSIDDCEEYCIDNNCEECSWRKYPPFTAEKQLKILCFIVNNKHSVTFHDRVFGYDKLTLEKTQENLAWAMNRIWQNLTKEEKEQIKDILK